MDCSDSPDTATRQRPLTPAFRAINAMDMASGAPANANDSRIQLENPSATPGTSPHDLRTTPFAAHELSTQASDHGGRLRSGNPSDDPTADEPGSLGSEKEKCGNDEDAEEEEEGRTESSHKTANAGKAKKRKGQKFFCTGYGDCGLAFTRSEHLARHIRKHTGERPFMCHCGRWFSRLDNLRQHSSTVHADEDIPADSLAATGTRYQRHIRTERIRQPARPRAVRPSSISQASPSSEAPAQSSQPGARERRHPEPAPPSQQPTMLSQLSLIAARERRRPDPITVPQTFPQGDPAFSQYRNDTPPESPISAASPQFRSSALYQRHAPYPPPASSPLVTPTSMTYTNGVDSPFSNQSAMAQASEQSRANRRLSMPVPITPTDAGSMMSSPSAGEQRYAEPAPISNTTNVAALRRNPRSIVAMDDDRRRTWHSGGPFNFQQSPLARDPIVRPGGPFGFQSPVVRDPIARTTNRFAQTSLTSGPVDDPRSAANGPIASAPHNPTDRLPSIHSILNGPPESEQGDGFDRGHHQRNSWAGNSLEQARQQRNSWTPDVFESESRPMIDPERLSIPDRLNVRRVAPGQTRSSHGRSISNIETRRRGVYYPNNPFSGNWAETNGESRLRSSTPLSTASNRNSWTFGGEPSLLGSREHRQSFGSSNDSGASDGVATPVANVGDDARLRIIGEPGDAIYHSESPDGEFMDISYEMPGVVATSAPNLTIASETGQTAAGFTRAGDEAPTSISRLDALVSVATGAYKAPPGTYKGP